ncbi:MAG: hypothetical protein AB1Z98_13620 [Nannocystaceae bacterium]
MEIAATIWTSIIILTFLVVTISFIWIVVQSFKEHVLWGIGVLFIPVVYIVFVVLNWKYSKRPFLLGLAAFAALFIELLIAKLFGA